MKITVADFRRCGVCPAARGWFERNGLDWRSFVRGGVDLAALRATGEHADLIDRLEASARKREADHG